MRGHRSAAHTGGPEGGRQCGIGGTTRKQQKAQGPMHTQAGTRDAYNHRGVRAVCSITQTPTAKHKHLETKLSGKPRQAKQADTGSTSGLQNTKSHKQLLLGLISSITREPFQK